MADRLGRPLATVKKQIDRGRKRLLSLLGAKQLSAATAAWLAERSEASPGMTASLAKLAGTLKDVPRLPPHWPWIWAGLVAVGLAAGGTGLALTAWPDAAATRGPGFTVSVRPETADEKAGPMFRDRVVPELAEAAKGLLIGGGEVSVSEVGVVFGGRTLRSAWRSRAKAGSSRSGRPRRPADRG